MRSMTGYGSGRSENKRVVLDVELRAVNSRYLDLVFRIPREYSSLEPRFRELLSEYFLRGRVEISVTRTPIAADATAVNINNAVFDAYWNAQLALAVEHELDLVELRPKLFCDLMSRRELYENSELEELPEDEKELIEKLLRKTAAKLNKMRIAEGAETRKDLTTRLKALTGLAGAIGKTAITLPDEYSTRLKDRLKKISPDLDELSIDETRLATEVAYLADRVDVSEELARLDSHIAQFEKATTQEGTGRKLNFILQELNREFNTIASKAQNAEIQAVVVDAKSEIEKLREQVQNIE